MLGVIAITIAATFLFAVYFVFFREQYEPLYTNLRPAEAAAVVAELEGRNIPYQFTDEETTILVPADDLAATKIAIAGSDLSINGLVGFELFNESDMGLTEFAQKINYQRALQGELSRTIMMIDGIENARVHLALPARAIFRRDQSVAKAAVTIQPVPGRKPGKSTVRGIQELVAAAVSDLSLANVSVIDAAGRVISDTVPRGGTENVQPQEKTAVQKFYEARIRDALGRQFPGRNPEISVAVSNIPSKAGQKVDRGEAGLTQQLGGTLPGAGERDYRLLVVVTFRATPEAETKTAMTETVAEAIGYDEALGDQIFFVADPAVSTPPRAPAAADYAPPTISPEPTLPFRVSPITYWWSIGLAALFLCILLFIFLRRKPVQTAGDADDPASFAEQLQAKLDGLNEHDNAQS